MDSMMRKQWLLLKHLCWANVLAYQAAVIEFIQVTPNQILERSSEAVLQQPAFYFDEFRCLHPALKTLSGNSIQGSDKEIFACSRAPCQWQQSGAR